MATKLQIISLDNHATGYPQMPMPDRMSVAMMRRLLGGKFPYAMGFSWGAVAYFKYEDGHWEPYNSFGEILPAPGFQVEAKLDAEIFEFAGG